MRRTLHLIERRASASRGQCSGGPGYSPARFIILLLTVLLPGCTSGTNSQDPGDTMEQRQAIEQVLERRTPELMRIEGVEGVGQALCDNEPCIRVYIRDESVRTRVPGQLDGYAVSAVVTGTVRARTTD